MTARPGLHPSVPALAFAIWWVVASVVFPERMLNADGDMLRHIRHGQEMLAQGALIHHDPFSFTRGGDPFVGFEYGSQLVYGYMWWPVPSADGSFADCAFSARGIFGQYLYVNPAEDLVIAVLSARSKPKGAEVIVDNDFFNAVVEATVQRSRPVILTALAAILAFIPLTHSVFWGTLAYTLIGGTFAGTVLTLVFLPALYAIWFRIRPATGNEKAVPAMRPEPVAG